MNLWRRIVRWVGFGVLAFGAVTMVWSFIVLVRIQTGWGLTEQERCCGNGGTIALALLVSGMFFFLIGAGAVLISRMGSGPGTEGGSSLWLRLLPATLFVTGSVAIVLATVFAGMGDEFGDATIGIVSYCMLIGVGLLFAGWGLKRARDQSEHP